MATATITFDTKTLRDAYVAGAEAVRNGVINACRERLAALDAASPEAAAWREVEAACVALELPPPPPRKRRPRYGARPGDLESPVDEKMQALARADLLAHEAKWGSKR